MHPSTDQKFFRAEIPALKTIVAACLNSSLGKRLPQALYIHRSGMIDLPPLLQEYVAIAHQILQTQGIQDDSCNLIKLHFDKQGLSFLNYPNFDSDPHPALQTSIYVDFITQRINYLDYRDRDNPPILHRKETFLAPNHPNYSLFATLTAQQEQLGLLKDSRSIGTQKVWAKKLAQHRIEIIDHVLACPIAQFHSQSHSSSAKISRHRAALVRKELSKPVRTALEAQLFNEKTTFFDYGCGHGSDLKFIAQKGFQSSGWDPYYQPQIEPTAADIVNLGYIINVIEDLAERREAMLNAWDLTQQVLIVSAQVMLADPDRDWIAYGDGVITQRNTFQKYFEQDELKIYIDQVLGVDSIPVALGIFFVFRDESQAQAFRASRFRSRATTPRIRLSIQRFEETKTQLQPLMDFFTQRGRLPKPQELESSSFEPLQETFGSVKRAFRLVLQATDVKEWDAIADKRRNDLLVFIALSHFERRPKFGQLPVEVQQDIRGFFGSYQQACAAADLMLISLGNTEMIRDRCTQSPIGKHHSNSLWVHHSALDQLDPLLRLYEGCASRTIGRPEEATVIKFHISPPKITYLFYPTFDQDPHPSLHTAMQIDLRDLQVRYQDYDRIENPLILHQKDELVAENYPNREIFAKLTVQEENWGLLDDRSQISDRLSWEKCLEAHCAELKGHRLIRRKQEDPLKLKFLKAQAHSRKRKNE